MREFKKATNEFKETMQIDSELAEVKKAFDGVNEDVKDAVDLKPEFESKAEEKAQTDEPEDDRKPAEDAEVPSSDAETPSDDFENLKGLKRAFDDIETNTDSSPPAEGRTTDEIPAVEDDKNETLKGPVDDK
jgi:hypothetical protein